MSVAGHFVNARDPKTLTVRQVMENALYTVSPDIKVIAIAETMTEGIFEPYPSWKKMYARRSPVRSRPVTSHG